MKNIIIGILILIICPLEILATVVTLGLYLTIMDYTITEKLVEKL
jgi:hypothetical protein